MQLLMDTNFFLGLYGKIMRCTALEGFVKSKKFIVTILIFEQNRTHPVKCEPICKQNKFSFSLFGFLYGFLYAEELCVGGGGQTLL